MFPVIAPAGMALLKLAGGTAAAGGVAAGVYGLSQIEESIKEGILKSGPNDPSDPTKFKTNPIQDLLIDEENLSNEYFKRQQNRLYNNNSKVRERVNQLGLTEKDIGTKSPAAFLADTKEKSEKLTTNKELKNVIEAMPGGPAKIIELGESPTTAMLRQAATDLDIEDKYGGGRGTLMARDKQQQSRYIDTLNRDLANRQLEQMTAQNNFDLQMGQLGMNNRRLDMENARRNRSDQRATLELLLRGMRNVSNNLVNY